MFISSRIEGENTFESFYCTEDDHTVVETQVEMLALCGSERWSGLNAIEHQRAQTREFLYNIF